MRFKPWGLSIIALALMPPTLWAQDEDAPSAAFWAWYMEYSDEEGQVFDPLALEELSALATAEEQPNDTEQRNATQADAEQKAAEDNEPETAP